MGKSVPVDSVSVAALSTLRGKVQLRGLRKQASRLVS